MRTVHALFHQSQRRRLAIGVGFVAWAGLCIAGEGEAAPPPATCNLRIVVTSDSMGMAPSAPFHDVIVFQQNGAGYDYAALSWDRAQAHVLSGPVDADKLQRLVAALKAPLQSSFRFASLGAAGPAALQEVRKSIGADLGRVTFTPRQRAWLVGAAKNQDEIEAAISRSGPFTHTDDYPNVAIAATLADCSDIHAKSVSQHLYMLPWAIQGRGKTFDPAIAHALYDILPTGFGERDRLGPRGPSPFGSLAEMFDDGIGSAFSELKVEDEAGPSLQALRAEFEVTDPGIASSMRESDAAAAPALRQDLIATLHLPGTPSNLKMDFRIRFVEGKTPGLGAEIDRAKSLLRRVASNPVLAGQMVVNANDHFRINYWYGTSLHHADLPMNNDMPAFARYMAKMKHTALTQRQLDDAVLVTDDGQGVRQWVVLPDGTTVLWHGTSDTGWKSQAESCGISPDEMPMYACVGKVFGPDGRPVK